MSSADQGRDDASAFIMALDGTRYPIVPPRLFGDCREAYVAAFVAHLLVMERIPLAQVKAAIAEFVAAKP